MNEGIGMQTLGWIIFNVFPWLLLALLVAVVAAFVAAIWPDKSPTFTLRSSEWECTQWHEERRMTPLLVGKVIVPQWRTVTVADVYVRRGFLAEGERG